MKFVLKTAAGVKRSAAVLQESDDSHYDSCTREIHEKKIYFFEVYFTLTMEVGQLMMMKAIRG